MENSKWSQKVIKPSRISPDLPSENAGNQLNTNGEPSRRLDPKNVQEDESEQQKHWQETQQNWRKRKVGDTHHYGGGVVERDRVYSPVKGTRDGHARVVREERIDRAKFESEKWGMLRICKEIIAKSGEKWKRRGKEETQRIREEERQMRLKIVEEKKKKYGRKNLKKVESDKLKKLTDKKLELAELRQNLWRCYREGDKFILPDSLRKKDNAAEEKVETSDSDVNRFKSIGDVLAEKRKKRLEKVKVEEEKWKRVREMLASLEEEIEWETKTPRNEEDVLEEWKIDFELKEPAPKKSRIDKDDNILTVFNVEQVVEDDDNVEEDIDKKLDQGEKHVKEYVMHGEATTMCSIEKGKKSSSQGEGSSKVEPANHSICDKKFDLKNPEKKEIVPIVRGKATYIAAKSAKSDRFGLGIGRTGKNSEISLQHPIRREKQDPICEEPMEPQQMSFVQRMRLKFDRN